MEGSEWNRGEAVREVTADGKGAVGANLAVDREIPADCDCQVVTLRGYWNRHQADDNKREQQSYFCVVVHTNMLDAGFRFTYGTEVHRPLS